jgi:hypothetical protein
VHGTTGRRLFDRKAARQSGCISIDALIGRQARYRARVRNFEEGCVSSTMGVGVCVDTQSITA